MRPTPPLADGHRPPPSEDDSRRRPASLVATPLRTLGLCVASLAVMLPWPLVGILVTRSSFDDPSEAVGLFGGMTLFPLVVLAFFSVPDEVLHVILIIVWIAVALLPGLVLRRQLSSWWSIAVVLGVQTTFSFLQAVMGAFLIVGKNI